MLFLPAIQSERDWEDVVEALHSSYQRKLFDLNRWHQQEYARLHRRFWYWEVEE